MNLKNIGIHANGKALNIVMKVWEMILLCRKTVKLTRFVS